MLRIISTQIFLVGLSLSTISCGLVNQSPAPTVSAQLTPPVETPGTSKPTPQTGSGGMILSNSPTPAATQRAQRKTVADYFLAIPDKYFQQLSPSGSSSQAERQRLLEQAKQGQKDSIYDPDNGYLRLVQGGDTCPTYTVVIFSRPSASPLVALSFSCDAGDQVSILDPDRNWQAVTTAVLPDNLAITPDLDALEVELPRFGRTIKVRRESKDRTLVKRYRFNGQRFVEE